ncbi:MAG: hypothetical protein QXH91_03210 [Candidatus Bathyarchaeia archaeon]
MAFYLSYYLEAEAVIALAMAEVLIILVVAYLSTGDKLIRAAYSRSSLCLYAWKLGFETAKTQRCGKRLSEMSGAPVDA